MVTAVTVFPLESTLVALVVALLGMTRELLELMYALDETRLVCKAELVVVLLPLPLSSLLLLLLPTAEAADEVDETVWLDVCDALGVVVASDAVEVAAPPTVEVVVYVM